MVIVVPWPMALVMVTFDALLESPEAQAIAPQCKIKSDPVVGHRDSQSVVMAGHVHFDRVRLGVPDAIGQRFLYGSIDTRLVPIRQSVELSAHVQLDVHSVPPRDVAHVPFQRGPQAKVIEHAGPKTQCEIADGAEHLVDQQFAFGHCRAEPRVAWRPASLDSTQLHAQRREHLRDVVMKLTGEILPLYFLRRDQPLRELARLSLGFFGDRALFLGSPLEYAEPEDDRQRHHETEQNTLPEQPTEVITESGMPSGHFRTLLGQIRVVQFLDLLSNCQYGVAPWHDFLTQETGTAKDFLGDRPIEERIEGLPVLLQLRLKAANVPLVRLRQYLKFRERRHVAFSELGQALAVFRCVVARNVQEVVAHEDAREIDVGTQASQLGVHLVMVRVELIELRVDVLGFARRREHRHRDQQQETAESDCRHQPRSEPHDDLRTFQRTLQTRVTPAGSDGHPANGGGPEPIGKHIRNAVATLSFR
jgi:hypothetical protein